MSVFTSFAGSITANVPEISSYTAANVSVPTSSTEVEIVIPSSAIWISIYNRTDGLTKIGFVSGESGTNYITLNPGDGHEYTKKSGVAMSLFVQCPKAAQTIEMTYGHS
jgi:hypothetical protein